MWDLGPERLWQTMHFVSWLIVDMRLSAALRSIASERRLQILDWLKNPADHFPPQVDGNLQKDGVCGLLIARKLRVSQPTASEHLRILVEAHLVRGKKIKQWTFYNRDEAAIKKIKHLIQTRV